jgi:hypothetical protein
MNGFGKPVEEPLSSAMPVLDQTRKSGDIRAKSTLRSGSDIQIQHYANQPLPSRRHEHLRLGNYSRSTLPQREDRPRDSNDEFKDGNPTQQSSADLLRSRQMGRIRCSFRHGRDRSHAPEQPTWHRFFLVEGPDEARRSGTSSERKIIQAQNGPHSGFLQTARRRATDAHGPVSGLSTLDAGG